MHPRYHHRTFAINNCIINRRSLYGPDRYLNDAAYGLFIATVVVVVR